MKDVAGEIGVSPDALSAKLAVTRKTSHIPASNRCALILSFCVLISKFLLQDGDLLPDLLGKVVKWLSQHAHMGTWNKGENLKCKNSIKSEGRAANSTEDIVMLDSDTLDPAVKKAFSLERTLESNICNDTTNNTICTLTENCTGNGTVVDQAKANGPILKKEESGILAPDHSIDEQVITQSQHSYVYLLHE